MGSTPSKVDDNSSLSSLLSRHPVFLFSATHCSFCRVAKRTFDDLGTEYTAVEVDRMTPSEGGRLAGEVKEATGGQTSVPQVFICGRWIGGCQETRAMLASGQLQVLKSISGI